MANEENIRDTNTWNKAKQNKKTKKKKRKQSMKTRLKEMFTRLFRLSSNSEFYSLKMENRWRYFLIYYFALKNFGWMKYRNIKIY